jgi:excisionase family DNA binding protein
MKASKVKESPIMRADEVCRLLKIGRNTLYEWCRLGIIPHKRVGRVLLFSRKLIYGWLENSENIGGIN